jgi:cytochrome c-type biogenesis protein
VLVLAAAFVGGVVSFVSPCVLPLVPVFLSVTTGLGLTDLAAGGRRPAVAVLRGTGLFVAGFSAVFIALGLSVTALGATLLHNQQLITRLSGVVVISMALLLVAGAAFPGVVPARELRLHPPLHRLGSWAAPVAGASFAFGWTPCIGPVLASILAVGAGQGSALRGGVLLAAYSAGLAVPFLLTGLAFRQVLGALRWTRRHTAAVTVGSAVVMGTFGALLLVDRLAWLSLQMQHYAQVLMPQ